MPQRTLSAILPGLNNTLCHNHFYSLLHFKQVRITNLVATHSARCAETGLILSFAYFAINSIFHNKLFLDEETPGAVAVGLHRINNNDMHVPIRNAS